MPTEPRAELLRFWRKQERKAARAKKIAVKHRLPIACKDRTVDIVAALFQLGQECGENSWLGCAFEMAARRIEKLLDWMD